MDISIGLAGATPAPTVRAVAQAAEDAGLQALWLNETAGVDALAGLADAAAVTQRLRLGVGVIPLDRFPAEAIAARVERVGIPPERLLLGVGSGGAAHARAVVAAGVEGLRSRTTAPIIVGGLGPLVRRVGAELGDGVLLNWLPPAAAAEARHEARAQATAGDRPRPHVALYVRTAVDAAGVPRRDAETVAYAGYPAYKANYARLGMDPFSTILPQPGDDSIGPGGAEYRDSGIDELVLRAMTFGDEIDDYVRFTEQAGEALGLRS